MDDRKTAAILVHSVDESRIVTAAVNCVSASDGAVNSTIACFEQSPSRGSVKRPNSHEARAIQIHSVDRAASIVARRTPQGAIGRLDYCTRVRAGGPVEEVQ